MLPWQRNRHLLMMSHSYLRRAWLLLCSVMGTDRRRNWRRGMMLTLWTRRSSSPLLMSTQTTMNSQLTRLPRKWSNDESRQCFHLVFWYCWLCVRHSPRGTGSPPFSPFFLPYPLTSSFFTLFLLFPFIFSYSAIFFLLSIFSLSTRIVTLHFQAGGRRRRLSLGFVCLCLFCVICIS